MTWDTSKWTLQNLNSNPKTEKKKKRISWSETIFDQFQ